jgi:hypothetical protein
MDEIVHPTRFLLLIRGGRKVHLSRRYFGRMAQTVETSIRENIFGVFGEHDAQKRRSKIAALWAEDGVFIAPEARYE